MRFYSWKMLLYILFLTVTGIVSGIYLWKSPYAIGGTFWQSVWSFENDPEFKSFHLDGQTIVLDDYLEIRPENRDKVQRYIDEGKLKIGPFYILQDDYLISSEANVRNTLIGQAECAKWGKSTQIGYFPDTFGNMGQAPQILQKSGIHVAAFGRGVKPIGFDNQVLEDEQFTSQFLKCTGKGQMEVVSSVFFLLTGTVTGMKFQWIKTKPWFSGSKN